MSWKIPLFKIYSDATDVAAVTAIINRGSFWADGPEIIQFEEQLATYIGTNYAAAFNSGTSALHAILEAYEVRGHEVIVPTLTFISTVNAILLAGGIPVFAESEPETLGLDVTDVAQRITKKTKAIIALHYGGSPSRDSIKLWQLAEDNDITLVSDAAESLGAEMYSQKVGSIAHAAMFSFCQNKLLPTGEGGMIMTDDEHIYEKLKLVRSHGRVETGSGYFASTADSDYISTGYNYRLPTMAAALGLAQLAKVQKLIDMRRERAAYYSKNLKDVAGITPPHEREGHYNVYQLYTITCKNRAFRDNLQQHLATHGIMSRVYFEPAHLKTLYVKKYGCKAGDLPQTEEISGTILSLPIWPHMTPSEQNCVLDAIHTFKTKA